MRKILVLIALVMASPVWANCFTGFACSIDSLQIQQNIATIENYFSKNVIEPNYILGKSQILNYNDLFLFNTIV